MDGFYLPCRLPQGHLATGLRDCVYLPDIKKPAHFRAGLKRVAVTYRRIESR